MKIYINESLTTAKSLIMVIAAGDEYKTFVISIDNAHTNKVYPKCGSHASVHDYKSKSYPTRLQTVTNNQTLDEMQPLAPSQVNTWPLFYSLRQYPDCNQGIEPDSCQNQWLFDLNSADPVQKCNSGLLPANLLYYK